MKTDKLPLAFAIFAVIVYYSNFAFIIWALVNFIIYLVKDTPFNWLPIWLLCVTIGLILLFMIIALFMPSNKTQDLVKKSPFHARLEEIQNKNK